MKRLTLLMVGAALAACAEESSAPSAARVTQGDLADLTASSPVLVNGAFFLEDVNASGLAVGWTYGKGQTGFVPVVRLPGQSQATRLPMPAGYVRAFAQAVNANGQIVGWSQQSPTLPYRWTPSGNTWVAEVMPIQPGTYQWVTNDINGAGTVVGSRVNNNAPYEVAPIRWTATNQLEVLPLPPGATEGEATAVTDAGTITGWYRVPGQPPVGAVWRSDGTIQALPGLAGSTNTYPEAMNESGIVVGYAYVNNAEVAVRWVPDPANPGQWLAPEVLAPGAARSTARDVNEAGQIAGNSSAADLSNTRAWVWENGQRTDLPGAKGIVEWKVRAITDGPAPILAGQAVPRSGGGYGAVWTLQP